MPPLPLRLGGFAAKSRCPLPLKGEGKEDVMKYDGEMLARLVAQAEAQPVGTDMLMIRALIEEASELGVGRALERLGLADGGAEDDVRELRELLGAWRDAKKAARGAVVAWVVRIVMALVLLGMAVKLGLLGLAHE